MDLTVSQIKPGMVIGSRVLAYTIHGIETESGLYRFAYTLNNNKEVFKTVWFKKDDVAMRNATILKRPKLKVSDILW